MCIKLGKLYIRVILFNMNFLTVFFIPLMAFILHYTNGEVIVLKLYIFYIYFIQMTIFTVSHI